jgi:hypothetical protein
MRRALTLVLVLSLFLARPAAAAAQATTRVYYAGPAGGVRQALTLAGFALVNDVAQAQAIVLNRVIPDGAAIAARVQAGAGLVLILGPNLTTAEVGTLLGVPVGLERRETPLSLTTARGMTHPLLTEVAWSSAPQVRERLALVSPASDLLPLVLGLEEDALVLGMRQVGQGQVYVFTPFLDVANLQIQQWAYFNYLIYHLTARSAGATPLSFADYPASPVPHARDRAILIGLLVAMLLSTGVIFLVVRRYSLTHP